MVLTFARIPQGTGSSKVQSAGAPRDALRRSDIQCLHVLPSSETGSIRKCALKVFTKNRWYKEIKTNSCV